MAEGRKLDKHKAVGMPLYAENDWNVVAREVESLRNMRGENGITIRRDPAGTVIRAASTWKFGLFELTEAMKRPGTIGVGAIVDADNPDCMRAENAKALLLHGDWKYTLDGSSGPRTATLYHPTNIHDTAGIGGGIFPHGIGSRVYAGLNPQTGRWEMITPPMDLWRFELTAALSLDGSATAKLLYGDGAVYETSGTGKPEVEFTVWDMLGKFSKPATLGGQTGADGFAKYMPDSRRWEIVEMDMIAQFIKVTLSYDMATTDASQSCTVDRYWDGYNPLASYSSPITVYNEAAAANYKFSGSAGDKFKAQWDDRLGRYVFLCGAPGGTVQWGKATQASADADVSHDCPWVQINPCDDCLGASPDTETTIDVVLPERDWFTHSVATGDVIAYEESECGAYTCDSDYSTPLIRWAKAQSDWSGSQVSCKNCDADGTGVTGDAFYVQLPHDANGMSGDPCIFADAVIGYLWSKDESDVLIRVCVTDYMDDKIGTVKMWNASEASIPEGWRVLAALKGKFPVGAGVWTEGARENEYALAATGGYDYHGKDGTGATNNHTDHVDHTAHHHDGSCAVSVVEEAGTQVWMWVTGSTTDGIDSAGGDADFKAHDTHDLTDNRPNFYALFIIERFE